MAEDFSSTSRKAATIAQRQDAGSDHLAYPRTVVVGVVILSLAVLALVGWNMKSRLSLTVPALGNGVQEAQTYTDNLMNAADDQQHNQDSDGDGLSDYDEVHVYGTSPFLADTNGDGIPDGLEVREGKDPTCKSGSNCTLLANPSATPSNSQTPANFYTGTPVEQILNDPNKIRQLLVTAGVNPQVAQNIDDQSLQILAQQAFQSDTQATPDKIAMLQSLTPDQMRKLLLQSGMDPQTLSQITDDQLKSLIQEALAADQSGASSGQTSSDSGTTSTDSSTSTSTSPSNPSDATTAPAPSN